MLKFRSSKQVQVFCHTYFDAEGDLEVGRRVIHNAKTRRVSVCNSLDCLIIHRSRIVDLPYLVGLMPANEVEIFADPDAFKALAGNYPAHLLHPANKDSFGTEFLSYKMAIKTVSSFEEALDHIAQYGSKHSEAIISANRKTLDDFLLSVDAAAVYANASTAFTDGGPIWFGGRNWYQYPKTACTRSDGASGDHHIQMVGRRRGR